MSQISDVGVNFKMTGGNAFEQQIKGIETSFKHLSTALGNNQIKGHLDKMEGHFRGMHRGIKAQLRLTETAIAGFLGGKVVSGLKNWVLGGTGADIDKQKDYLRIHGATTEGLNNLSKSLDQLADKRPTDKLSGWSIGENIMSMLGGLDDPALVKRAIDANSNLAYI